MIAVPPGQAPRRSRPRPRRGRPGRARTVGDTAGAPIPRSFAGFSMEYWSARATSAASGPTRSSPAVQTLAAGRNGAPTIRIGGNSTDETWWNPVAAPRPAAWRPTSRPVARRPRPMGGQHAHADHPRREPRERRQRQRRRLRPSGRPDTAARNPVGARDRQRARPLPRPREFAVGSRRIVRGLRRPAGYGPADYRSELQTFRAALAAAAPGVPMAGGGFATSAWRTARTTCSPSRGPGRWASAPTPTRCTPATGGGRGPRCPTRGRCWAPARSLHRWPGWRSSPRSPPPTARPSGCPRRTRPTAAGSGREQQRRLGAVGRRHALRPRRRRRAQRELPHVHRRALRPVDFGLRKGHFAGFVRPLFYAMLLFDRATPHGARLLPSGPNPPTAPLKTWATLDPEGTRRVVVINKDPVQTGASCCASRRRGRARCSGCSALDHGDERHHVRRPRLRRRDPGRQAPRQAVDRAGRPPQRRVPDRHAAGQRGARDDLRRPLTGAALA